MAGYNCHCGASLVGYYLLTGVSDVATTAPTGVAISPPTGVAAFTYREERITTNVTASPKSLTRCQGSHQNDAVHHQSTAHHQQDIMCLARQSATHIVLGVNTVSSSSTPRYRRRQLGQEYFTECKIRCL